MPTFPHILIPRFLMVMCPPYADGGGYEIIDRMCDEALTHTSVLKKRGRHAGRKGIPF